MSIRNAYPIRPQEPAWLRRYEAALLAWSIAQAVAAITAGVLIGWFFWGW